MEGAELASYRIVGRIGEGGMGMVYRAEHVLLGRAAAVKVLRPELTRDATMVNRFFNEARAATSIRHPGIVEIYDFGYHANGSAYIVMELLQGESLAQRLRRGRMPVRRALQVSRQIAGALAAAHATGIIHRDLKPDNVFLVPDPEVPGGERIKLLDFGIAKLLAEQPGAGHTTTGAVIGTPTYMAPEQCRGVRIDQRADFYSLGCILFEAITGVPPFIGEGAGDVLAAHIHVPPPSPRERAPDVPPAVEALILRLLAKSPEQRPAMAAEVISLIDATGIDHPSGSMAVIPGVPVPPSQTITTLSGATIATPAPTGVSAGGRSRAWMLVAALGALLVVGGVTAAVVAGGGGEKEPAAAAPVARTETAAGTETGTETAPAPAPISLEVISSPPGATLLIDGKHVGITPYRGELPRRDGKVHLELQLAGYQALQLDAPGDASITRSVALTAVAPAPPPPAPTAPAAPKRKKQPPPVDRDRGVNPF